MSDEVSFYPPAPLLGSNAIGKFTVGVSPIGTISAFNYLQTIISQYANSPILLSLIESFNDAMDQTRNFDSFYDLIWNLDTAQGYGLDVWGRIVGVSRNLEVSNSNFFGFEQGNYDTFAPGGASPFYSGQSTTNIVALTDEAYRQLILAKAAANICSGSVPAINAILMTLFGPGNVFGPGGDCYVTDPGGMAMAYTFKFEPNPVQQSIIFQSGVLPKPVGVNATVDISP